MRGTLVLALDRTGRLQTACWGDTSQTVRPTQFSSGPSGGAGDRDEIALRRANVHRQRNFRSANLLLSQKEEVS